MQVAFQTCRHGGPFLRSLAPVLRAALQGTSGSTPAAVASTPPHQQRAGFASGGSAQPANAMALIKELREKSGAPISDVKACGWEVDAAYDALRKKGLAAAAKKAARHAADGLVSLALAPTGTAAAAVEVNSETDFVGRAALFRQLASEAAAAALAVAPGGSGGVAAGEPREISGDELNALLVPSPSTYPDSDSPAAASPAATAAADTPLGDACAEVAAKVRENVRARRGFLLAAPQGGLVGGYVHQPAGPGCGRIVTAVALVGPDGGAVPEANRAAAAELASQLAMHIAGMRPRFKDAASVPAAEIEAERAVLLEQAAGSGKPQAVLEKMVAGRLSKWTQEICLVDQRFILDDSQTVAQVLKAHGNLRIAGFFRAQVGEGLAAAVAKDFATEVAEMAAAGAA